MARLFGRVILIALIAAAAGVGWLAWFALAPVPLRSAPIDVHVKSGSTLRVVSQQLAEAGVDFAPWKFTLLVRLAGHASKLKAGSYELAHAITPWQLMEKLTAGDVSLVEVAFIEGWTFRQIRTALDNHASIEHDSAGLTDAEILARIGASERSPEGLFFPDTYLVGKGSSDLDLLRRAYRSMQQVLEQGWANRNPGLPYASPYELLIMASIVEKETGVAAERPLVAAVFVNRLRQGMALQTDPTVIFGMGAEFDGNLRKRDLQRDTAYNTYTRPGLPPTPIALPGLASIQAALNPAPRDYLYFVARGNGTSEFSRTLDEHNRAVARYQKKKASN
jgi:UPF0755 protein